LCFPSFYLPKRILEKPKMSILELGKTASFYGGKWTIPFRPKRANTIPHFEKKPAKEKQKRKNIFRALIKVSRSFIFTNNPST